MTMITDVLFEIWKTAEFDYDSPEQKHHQTDIYNSIAWYAETGRACVQWERALAKADPKKLLRYIAKQDDQSVEGQIRYTTKYLRQYCGYSF